MLRKTSKNAQRDFIVRTISLSKNYRQYATEALEKSHLSHSTALIVTLLEHTKGDCSQKYLADQLDISPASLVPLLKQIEANGLITRQTDPADKRVNHIALTAKGEMLSQQAQQVLSAVRHQMFANISSEDIEAALRVVTALQTALSEHKSKDR